MRTSTIQASRFFFEKQVGTEELKIFTIPDKLCLWEIFQGFRDMNIMSETSRQGIFHAPWTCLESCWAQILTTHGQEITMFMAMPFTNASYC